MTLDIEYEGYINVLTSWNQNKYIATKDDIMLPPGSLAWYPKVNQSSCMAYKINLSSKNNVYSNLPLLNKTSNFLKKIIYLKESQMILQYMQVSLKKR
ncbi:hypothetical protein ACK2FP_01885 [Clostridioides difficile]